MGVGDCAGPLKLQVGAVMGCETGWLTGLCCLGRQRVRKRGQGWDWMDAGWTGQGVSMCECVCVCAELGPGSLKHQQLVPKQSYRQGQTQPDRWLLTMRKH